MEIKESRKMDKYLDFAQEYKRAVKYEADGDANCSWCTWNGSYKPGIIIIIILILAIKTERKIMSNRPDIVFTDEKRKTFLPIDMAVPTDNTISVKECIMSFVV